MKVNLDALDRSNLSVTSTEDKNTETSAVSGTEQPLIEDKATLSSDSATVKELTAQALASSEVRQDKVEALRQAIQSGNYKVDADKIAEAMIRESE